MKEPVLPQNTFVLRIWWSITWDESSGQKRSWRGKAEHIQTGESINFTDMETLVGFIGRFVVEETGSEHGL